MQVETQHLNFIKDVKKCSYSNGTKSKLDECLYRIAKKEGYISCDITKKALPADGGNYLAVLYEIDIKGTTSDGEKETAIFAKTMAPDAIDIGVLSLPDVYKTELYVYKELIKIFHNVQDEANVPFKERYNMVKCYDESYDQAIIMENVTSKGFKTWFRMDVVSLEMAEECVKQLARFHGLSFVLQERRPEYFAKKIKTMQTALIFGDTWKGFVKKMCDYGLDCLDINTRAKIEKRIHEILLKLEDYHYDESSKYCLCHGDYRANNIMVKEVDGKVTEVIPLDYQLIFFGCPIIDFLYFIYMGTDRQFRSAHLANLKDLYYKSLDKFLRYFDLSAESVFPRKVFENIYEEKFDYGLIIAFMYTPFCFLSEEHDIPDVAKEPLLDIELRFDDRNKDRLRGAVEEFIDLGYFYNGRNFKKS